MIEEIKKLICATLGIAPERVGDDTDLVDDLGVDSLDVAELLMSLEEKYGVAVPDEDAPDLRTAKDIAVYVEQKL
ncbi:MAG: acyl carrier protein [Clostridia bacterium]|nr:acyl carrier protein [Clostridia bacterium]